MAFYNQETYDVDVQVLFHTNPLNYYYTTVTAAPGWNFPKVKKIDFLEYGSPTWSSIEGLSMNVQGNGGASSGWLNADDFRIVKADPDNAADTNDTGTAWDKAAETGSDAGEWHVYAGNRTGEPGKPYSYGQIKTATSPAQWYLSHKPLATTSVVTGTVQAGVYLKDADGQAGLSFFVKDVTADSWEMYAVEVDSAADKIRLVKWVGGTRTVLKQPDGTSDAEVDFTLAANQIVWLGADFREFSSGGGRLKVYASLVEGNLIQATNLVISTQDTSLTAGGSVGLLSKQANVRFVNFVAGSPAHAEVADVARALDGPILAGASKRVRYNSTDDQFEWSEDGETWTEVGRGVIDHGALTGLGDDDHPQYHNDARGDARYSQLGHSHTASDVGALSTAYLNTRALSDANNADTAGIVGSYLNSANKPTGTDHAALTMSYSGSWSTQLAADWRTNRWYVRGQNNGTWGSWHELLKTADDQTVAGVKTFSSFPVTPSSAPTTDYQVANKKYVDDNAGRGSAYLKRIHLKTGINASMVEGSANEFNVNFNLETYRDTYTYTHSSGVVTVLSAGVYRIYANMVYENGNDSSRNTADAYVKINGTAIDSTRTADYDRGAAYGKYSNNKVYTVLSLSASDTVAIGTYAINEDGVMTITADRCEFIIEKVAAESVAEIPHADYLDSLGSYVWTNASDSPRNFPAGVSTSFVQGAHGWPSYGTVLTVRGYTSSQDGSVFQLYAPYNSTYGGDYAKYRMGLYNNAPLCQYK